MVIFVYCPQCDAVKTHSGWVRPAMEREAHLELLRKRSVEVTVIPSSCPACSIKAIAIPVKKGRR